MQKLRDSFDVDDFLEGEGGGIKSADVVELYYKTNDRMANGSFNLRKWLTNDSLVSARKEIDA